MEELRIMDEKDLLVEQYKNFPQEHFDRYMSEFTKPQGFDEDVFSDYNRTPEENVDTESEDFSEFENYDLEKTGFKPLTTVQRKILGPKACIVYDSTRAYKNGKKVDWIKVGIKAGLIPNGVYDTESEDGKKMIDYLQESIISSAQQLYYQVQMESMPELTKMMPVDTAKFYFNQNNEVFKFDPETESFNIEGKESLTHKAYRESLYLTKFIKILKQPEFSKNLLKNINRKYDKYVKSTTEGLNRFLKERDELKANRCTNKTHLFIMRILPDITEVQAKVMILAMHKFMGKILTKDISLTCYMINMNIIALTPLVINKIELEGSAKIFYDSLVSFFNEVKRIKSIK